jgi:hypothetical protein
MVDWSPACASHRKSPGAPRGERRSPIAAIVVAACLAATWCGAPPPRSPAIEFTSIPEASEGGPDKLVSIAGRVSGARPGQRLVLFAKSGVWWVQPLVDEPFTSIQPDSTWTTNTHLGLQYGALLVDASYNPPPTYDELPTPGGAIIAVATVAGRATAATASRTLTFAGYEWEARQTVSDRGGLRNQYDPRHAWVDAQGHLHLKIERRGGEVEGGASPWSCAEVTLKRSLGYGTYVFTVRDVSHLEPSAVFSVVTWDPSGSDPSHREMGIELTKWGDPDSKNAQFVIQPYYVPANVARFNTPAGALSHSIRWEPGRALFRAWRGVSDAPAGPPLAEHEFTSGIPAPGGESIRIALYVFGHKLQLTRGTEVIVEKFIYLP